MQVMAGIEAHGELPTFEKLQKAVAYANEAMPMTKQTGLVAETHELQQVVRQTVERGLMFKHDERYMLTEEGKNVLRSES